jgi:type VI secretion system protein ImpG
MTGDFLEIYETELRHLREVCGEFAARHSGAAERLDLSSDPGRLSRDPSVKLLLEGVAHLAARVHFKLEAEFPRFTQSLLEVVFPQYLCPTPSMVMAGFEPDYQDDTLAGGFVIRRESLLSTAPMGDRRTSCKFRTAHEVVLWPVRLEAAAYHTARSLGKLSLPPGVRAKAAFSFRLRSTAGLKFNQLGGKAEEGRRPFDRLVFHIRDDGQGFVRGPGRVASLIHETLFARGTQVILQFGEGAARQNRVLPARNLQQVGFRDDEALLPVDHRTFQGFRLLREYFAFPDRFLFFALAGIGEALSECHSDLLDAIIVLKEEDPRLEDSDAGDRDQRAVHRDRFVMYTTPAVNLFPKPLDRVTLSDRFSEYRLVADKAAPLDFEVFALDRVVGIGSRPDQRQEFRPFYRVRDTDQQVAGFYVVYREPRALTEREKRFGQAPGYLGCDTYLSLVDPAAAPFRAELKELELSSLCTNRHLATRMAKDGEGADLFPIDFSGPFKAGIRCLSGPTEPVASPCYGEVAWRLISHLSLNFLSLIDATQEDGATVLRDALSLYFDPRRRELKRQVEGLRWIRARPVMRRLRWDTAAHSRAPEGVAALARGLELSIEFDEDAFTESGFFLLGTVLEHFFARYVSLNSFTELRLIGSRRGEIIHWPPRVGRKHWV